MIFVFVSCCKNLAEILLVNIPERVYPTARVTIVTAPMKEPAIVVNVRILCKPCVNSNLVVL